MYSYHTLEKTSIIPLNIHLSCLDIVALTTTSGTPGVFWLFRVTLRSNNCLSKIIKVVCIILYILKRTWQILNCSSGYVFFYSTEIESLEKNGRRKYTLVGKYSWIVHKMQMSKNIFYYSVIFSNVLLISNCSKLSKKCLVSKNSLTKKA